MAKETFVTKAQIEEINIKITRLSLLAFIDIVLM